MFLRDVLDGEADDIAAAVELIAASRCDVLAVSGLDHDHGLAALSAFRDRIGEAGLDYPHVTSALPNAGLDTGRDLDLDGRLRGARDAQGYGEFAGQGALAVLSRFEILSATTFNDLLWRDVPGSLIAPDDPAYDTQRLSSVSHMAVAIETGTAPLTLLAFHATPPVFDGPEDRNGRRNHDEVLFWTHYLDGVFGTAPERGFVLAGDANLDPEDGDGRSDAIAALLADRRLQDPMPRSSHAAQAAVSEAGANADHTGDPSLDTANWNDGPGEPGNLRVDYVLPSADWIVADTGVLWGSGPAAPRHGLVWVDLVPPSGTGAEG